DANVFCSSHLRCRQTYELMAENPAYRQLTPVFDPLLREVDYGPGSTWHDIEYELHCPERAKMGKFYYRFKHGESPADAYVRACLFW
ncbi:histidine phosphatase family protein, partial [Vibrio parahaemolyticus]